MAGPIEYPVDLMTFKALKIKITLLHVKQRSRIVHLGPASFIQLANTCITSGANGYEIHYHVILTLFLGM